MSVIDKWRIWKDQAKRQVPGSRLFYVKGMESLQNKESSMEMHAQMLGLCGLWTDNFMLPWACEKVENRWLMYLVAQKAGVWATEKWRIRWKELKKLFNFDAKYFPSL